MFVGKINVVKWGSKIKVIKEDSLTSRVNFRNAITLQKHCPQMEVHKNGQAHLQWVMPNTVTCFYYKRLCYMYFDSFLKSSGKSIYIYWVYKLKIRQWCATVTCIFCPLHSPSTPLGPLDQRLISSLFPIRLSPGPRRLKLCLVGEESGGDCWEYLRGFSNQLAPNYSLSINRLQVYFQHQGIVFSMFIYLFNK